MCFIKIQTSMIMKWTVIVLCKLVLTVSFVEGLYSGTGIPTSLTSSFVVNKYLRYTLHGVHAHIVHFRLKTHREDTILSYSRTPFSFRTCKCTGTTPVHHNTQVLRFETFHKYVCSFPYVLVLNQIFLV